MISVALCTYNGEKYIRQQLDSILTQTMPVDEIVIHDDCSTDSTYEILTDYASRYPRIFVRKNSANIGFLKNFENTLAECQ
jgi:glycosyltransferase involved in cell wall biosynthesis